MFFISRVVPTMVLHLLSKAGREGGKKAEACVSVKNLK